MSFEGHGIYHIPHAHVANIRMALANRGSGQNGTPVIAWDSNNDAFDHMWLVEPTGEADTYTIHNVSTGTYMDVTASAVADNTPIIGYQRTGNDNQKWIIRQVQTDGGDRPWKIQCKATGTFATLYSGGGSGTAIVGWRLVNSNGNQDWVFQKLSQTSVNVHATLLACGATVGQDFKNYLYDGLYLVLPRDRISAIWKASGLGETARRDGIYDSDEFAMTFKSAAATWGKENFKADGFAILCGMMFGTKASTNRHAYNWVVERGSFSTVTFFEPQNGTYSDDAWGYKAYFGLF
uniref:Ricin B-related lectin n=1 Tax=Cerioporus squamosus TaxID=2829415 RepID=Q75WT8_9APHY|nr:Ricin B-related lectin [Cerioporus squamosus]